MLCPLLVTVVLFQIYKKITQYFTQLAFENKNNDFKIPSRENACFKYAFLTLTKLIDEILQCVYILKWMLMISSAIILYMLDLTFKV